MIRSYTFAQGKVRDREVAVQAMGQVLAESGVFLWVDFEKPTEEEARAILDGVFHFHPLSIEDCIMDSPSPKVEEYNPLPEDKFTPYLFLVMHAVDYKDGTLAMGELNLFLGKNFLVTYHDSPLRSVAFIEDRCEKGGPNLAKGPDRLAHALLDSMVENYTPAMDALAGLIGEAEELALRDPRPRTLARIIRIKKEVLRLRQIVGPQSEVVARLARGEFPLIRPHLLPYYRDVHDALTHIAAQSQNFADSLTGILQVYLSMSSNRTGEVVKVLTVIAVITTPVMIIGTWYGMNFKDMPELNWEHGYWYAIALSALSTAATVAYFRKKKWF